MDWKEKLRRLKKKLIKPVEERDPAFLKLLEQQWNMEQQQKAQKGEPVYPGTFWDWWNTLTDEQREDYYRRLKAAVKARHEAAKIAEMAEQEAMKAGVALEEPPVWVRVQNPETKQWELKLLPGRKYSPMELRLVTEAQKIYLETLREERRRRQREPLIKAFQSLAKGIAVKKPAFTVQRKATQLYATPRLPFDVPSEVYTFGRPAEESKFSNLYDLSALRETVIPRVRIRRPRNLYNQQLGKIRRQIRFF